jgi:hypothetical protein
MDKEIYDRNMKKILLIVGMSFLGTVSALDTSCFFLKSKPIETKTGEVFQVVTDKEIYPLQGGVITPLKETTKISTPEYRDYSVVASSGLKNPDYRMISDNNPLSYIQFSSSPKYITLKMNTPVTAGDFSIHLDIDTYDLGELEISKDGKVFQPILLSDIDSFSFQYIRISFIDTLRNSKNILFSPTKIRDILVYKK